MNKFFKATLLLIFIAYGTELSAQYNNDITRELEIPDILDVESSEAHLYLLSESEGLVVYRSYADSLQWLYSSTGMQRRGNNLHADIRFAYLFGDNRRLTVIEPTTVLGVYSSTVLPDVPVSVRRIGNNLYLVQQDGSFSSISLETPESVDSEPSPVDSQKFGDRTVNDLATDANRFLYVLSDNRLIDIYQFNSADDELVIEDSVELNEDIQKIFYAGNELIGTNNDGEIYLIDSDGQTRFQNDVEHSVDDLAFWNDEIVVRTENGHLWIGTLGDDLTHWKENERAKNYFTVNKNRLYVSEFSSLFPVNRISSESAYQSDNDSESFSIEQIETVSLPFPKPLLLPINIRGYEGNISDVSLSIESSLENIQIRGNSLFWQPGASNTGRHQITVSATTPEGKSTQTTFTVDVKPFNAPPRFTPARAQSISADEQFELEITAFDPDGTHSNLIRYLGVDLPSGASLDEQTGIFTWEPTIRQVGNHQFRVIATDQFGAAASQEFEIRVLDIQEDESEETDNTNDS